MDTPCLGGTSSSSLLLKPAKLNKEDREKTVIINSSLQRLHSTLPALRTLQLTLQLRPTRQLCSGLLYGCISYLIAMATCYGNLLWQPYGTMYLFGFLVDQERLPSCYDNHSAPVVHCTTLTFLLKVTSSCRNVTHASPGSCTERGCVRSTTPTTPQCI